MDVRELLIEPIAFIPPARALESLATADAHRVVSGASHSIAAIVSHLIFWQEWFLQRCAGVDVPVPESAAIGWPAVPAGAWPDVERRFLDGLSRAEAAGQPEPRLDTPIEPAIQFPPLGHYSIGDALTHISQHNAHHLGQVVILRQLLGSWPPPSGSLTW